MAESTTRISPYRPLPGRLELGDREWLEFVLVLLHDGMLDNELRPTEDFLEEVRRLLGAGLELERASVDKK